MFSRRLLITTVGRQLHWPRKLLVKSHQAQR